MIHPNYTVQFGATCNHTNIIIYSCAVDSPKTLLYLPVSFACVNKVVNLFSCGCDLIAIFCIYFYFYFASEAIIPWPFGSHCYSLLLSLNNEQILCPYSCIWFTYLLFDYSMHHFQIDPWIPTKSKDSDIEKNIFLMRTKRRIMSFWWLNSCEKYRYEL